MSRDAQRLVNDGVLTGAVPAGDSWVARVSKWLDEMQEGRRLVMVAEFGGSLVGMGQLIFRFADGYQDPDAANGTDIAMVDTIRTRPDAPPNLATHIIGELERYARKRNIRTVTFLVPMDNNRALNQVKGWGFEEFRIMPEGTRLLAFFRKRIG
jgi:ribosomal protein S18 acetylase RimI-like enzyme